MKKMFLCLLIATAVLFSGCVQSPPAIESQVCEECEDCAKSQETIRDFYKGEFVELQNEKEEFTAMARLLWGDYWDCYIAFLCSDDKEKCIEYLSVNEGNIEYARMSCFLAKNYENYYQTFEEVKT